MEAQKLLHYLYPVRNRIWKIAAIRACLIGLLYGMVLASVWGATARFFPVPYYRPEAILIVVLGSIGGLLYAVLTRPTHRQAAKRMDDGGLEERIGTALSFLNEETPIIQIQREDAVKHAEAFVQHLRSNLPMPSYKKLMYSGTGMLFVLFTVLVWPNPMDALVAQKQAGQAWVKEQEKKVEKLQQEIKKKPVSDVMNAEMEKILHELQNGLEQTDSSKQVLDEMERTMKDLQKLAEQFERQRLQAEQWAEQLEEQSLLKQVGQGLLRMDRRMLEQGIDRLQRSIMRMTPEQKEQLANQLDQLAKTSASAGSDIAKQMQASLEELSKQLKASQPTNIEQSMKKLNEALSQALQQMQSHSQSIAQAVQAGAQIGQMGLPMANQLMAQGAALSNTWSANGLADVMASGMNSTGHSGNLPSNPNGSGSQGSNASPSGGGSGQGEDGSQGTGGSQSGSGGGSGSSGGTGMGTGGQGTDSGSGSSGSTDGSGSGSGTGNGAGGGSGSGTGGLQGGFGTGSRNLVTTPRNLQGEGDVYSDQGPVDRGGEVQKGGQSPVIDGVSRPYEEVYSKYANDAKSSLNRHPLPQSMQNLVRDYFTEIQPD